MLKNRKLSKGISRQGWYQFRALRIIGRWEATSQHCHKCVDLSTRTVVCDGCGAILDRDENGSHNIVLGGNVRLVRQRLESAAFRRGSMSIHKRSDFRGGKFRGMSAIPRARCSGSTFAES